jgi:hypothetical protein
MFKMKQNTFVALLIILVMTLLSGCVDDAQVASHNLVKSADNFEITRRIVFFNGITDNYLLEVEGKCAVFSDRTSNSELEVICKTGDEQYKKHFFGLSDNTAYFVEQIDSTHASAYHYRVTFKPQVVVPDVDVRVDLTDGPQSQK